MQFMPDRAGARITEPPGSFGVLRCLGVGVSGNPGSEDNRKPSVGQNRKLTVRKEMVPLTEAIS